MGLQAYQEPLGEPFYGNAELLMVDIAGTCLSVETGPSAVWTSGLPVTKMEYGYRTSLLETRNTHLYHPF